jgi:gliding motility-associated-like protein
MRTTHSAFIWLVLVVLSMAYNTGQGQNLVPNYSFENFTTCPTNYEGLCFGYAPPWSCASLGSADLFNSCGNPSMAGVPDNAIGSQLAHTGEGYAGFICFWPTISNYREYVMVQLTQPLVAGTWYYVTFFLSLADTGCGVEHVGAYFSATSPYQSQVTVLNLNPQVESNSGFISDQQGWTLVGGCFQAAGGEQYMVIGNFNPDSETPLDPDCNSGPYNYFYIDDVSVTEGLAPEEIDLDLGGPVEECFSYEIDPNHDGPVFIWSDGSNGPTLTVTETGVYTLTVTDGCNQGIDSIEVTINGIFPPVEIGPPTLAICAGEEYVITLDPDLEVYTWNDGSHSDEYSISTTGTYSVTLDDGCATSTDEIHVDVIDPPSPFDLGEDADLCLGEEIEIVLDPDAGVFLWQDGNTSSTYTIDMGGTYTLTISNMCGQETDEIVISDLEVPDIQIGPDEVTLCGGEILDIEIDPELGDILWQDGSSEPNYEITTSGVYTVFVTNQCGTGSDQIEVTVVPSPDVNLGPDTLLCEGQTIVLTTADSDGTYLWQDFSTADTFLVSGPGLYNLSISNDCGTASDDVFVDYLDVADPIDFGPDITLCPGEQIVLYAQNPGLQYEWQDLSTADSFVVTTGGTYHVTAYNNCGLQSDTINVTVNALPPTADLPDQLTLCQGQSLTLDANVVGVNYVWNDNSTSQQLNVTTPGTYSVTVSNSCGSDQDTVVISDGGPAPVVDLGLDLAICPGEQADITPIFSDVTSWTWQDGSTLPSYTVSGAGQISIEAQNSCGVAFDTMQISLLPATPPLDLGPDTSLCTGETYALSIATSGVSILWSDGSTLPAFTVSGPGEYFATISNSCGQQSDTIEVTALPDVPVLQLGPDQSLCPGELIVVDPGITNVNYLWQDGSTGPTFSTTQQATIILTISNNCGASTDTLNIIENNQGPVVDLGADILACEGETITVSAGVLGVNYLWQDGSTGSNFSTTQSEIVILEVSNNCGTDIDTVIIDIEGQIPTPNLGADTLLCEGASLVLASDADAITNVLWQNGSTGTTFTVTNAGTYILEESNHCGNVSDTIVVTYLDAPAPFSLGVDTTLCPGESIVLNAPFTTDLITWHDGSHSPSFLADQSGSYALTVSNACGQVSDDFELSYNTQVPIIQDAPPYPWCFGNIIQLDVTQTIPVAYEWQDGSTSPTFEATAPGTYQVEIISACSSVTGDFELIPAANCDVSDGVYIPNVFSPNGDGINDIFTVFPGSDITVTAMQGKIFDRWGNLVFASEAIPFEWNGFFNNEALQPGVFAYVIHVKYMINGREVDEVFAGDVTLVR